jgi:hypothetical protein
MRKKPKLSFDGGDYGSKKCKGGSAAACLAESGVRRLILSWCVWHEYGFYRREDFSRLNSFLKIFCKFYTFSAMCKECCSRVLLFKTKGTRFRKI